ncbi:hypothetical protein [Sphingomicrobium clamense]|uniref:Lipoprotein n=1 Tax=Sphingomicrobium clamense TaxID=2851013 RepID=A0ABS6V5W9_9SPHN|nr:hypothetical protein [Sphingomicrobium sp. B8]MBW0144960.1 hypothetical protein [Sphingomicrobium sp. B8]
MKTILTLGAALVLTACASTEDRYPTTGPSTSAPTPLAYNAVGDGWQLMIRDSGMTFQTTQGLATSDPYVDFLPSPNGDTYQGSKITAIVNRQGCALEGYDTTTYPHTVTVTVNNQTLTGCGGPPNGNDREPY